MDILILTGMSGAGKSLAANYLEDMGFFCIDNLPPNILPDLVSSYVKKNNNLPLHPVDTARMAFVIDVRSLELFEDIFPALERLNQLGISYRIIFLDATDQTLISRYKQSRRNHPLAQGRSIVQAIELERQRLAAVKELASDVIETSALTAGELRDMLYAMLSETDRDERMTILIQSFGFKYGIPVDCDCIIDVRFIPNPYYVPELKSLSGKIRLLSTASRPIRKRSVSWTCRSNGWSLPFPFTSARARSVSRSASAVPAGVTGRSFWPRIWQTACATTSCAS